MPMRHSPILLLCSLFLFAYCRSVSAQQIPRMKTNFLYEYANQVVFVEYPKATKHPFPQPVEEGAPPILPPGYGKCTVDHFPKNAHVPSETIVVQVFNKGKGWTGTWTMLRDKGKDIPPRKQIVRPFILKLPPGWIDREIPHPPVPPIIRGRT